MKQMIPAGKFKAQCLRLMDQVQKKHDSIIITKHGKPIAQLVPIADKKIKAASAIGCMMGTLTITGDIISPIDEDWDAENDQ